MDDLLKIYFDLLVQWNRRINLTAIDDWAGFQSKHVEDSLSILPHLGSAQKIIDLGTGAGIPGIILKIARPELQITLLDATRKKVSFCQEAIRRLGLPGIQAVWGRAEDEALSKALGVFDVVLSRATWKLKDFLPLALPYAGKGGRVLAMKGPGWQEELEDAAEALGATRLVIEGAHPYRLPDGEERCLVVFKVSCK